MSIYFVATRKDGLGERLRALINAIILSKKFSCEFKFTWPMRSAKQALFNVMGSPSDLFSKDFVDDHLISDNFECEYVDLRSFSLTVLSSLLRAF